ncbi:AMP-binding protein [Sphingobium sp. WCS2017Hpa-17]|uniref:class I adenylate-forming enzyme family protein n=1 Tax=Sphingobium sp. WCS2017Hpa-17 TaxID=3073638 RepID=UPI00288988C0|nr:AMP-binding protein [Sphingobium sp. WCS2017Hpa-17]
MPTLNDPAGLRWEMHGDRVVRCPAIRPLNIDTMFDEAAARCPSVVAAVDGDLRLTYAELSQAVAACAGRLQGLSLARADRVSALLGNRLDFLVLLLATARLGLIFVPMNIRQSSDEIAYALRDSGASALFCETELAERLPRLEDGASCRHVEFVDDDNRIWMGDFEPVPGGESVEEDAPCCLIYTSGTTGRPKGAVLTHFGLVANCIASREGLDLHDGEVSILAAPASHVTGLVLVLLLMVSVAGKTVFLRQFKASQFLQTARQEGLTYAIMVPAMYKLCLMEPSISESSLSSWRVGAFGGAPMPEATIDALAQVLPDLSLVNIYGATETSAPAVMMPSHEIRERASQVGRPLPFCDIRIMDEEGREVPAGEPGEVWIAGPMVVPGYWNRPDADEQGFAGGFWKSGDLGAMDADGYLSLTDRKKDMINRGGFKIYSIEVENALMRHPAVVEAAVVPRSCPVLGERVVAFVVARDSVEAEELRALCAAWLSDYKVPDNIGIVEGSLPRNANGKLLKTEMRGWASERFG